MLFLPVLKCDWNRFDFFMGSQGFKDPANFAAINASNPNQRGGSGSFGFYQGFNFDQPFPQYGISGQFGLRATQSNLSGADFTRETRHQIFLTAGLSRRVDYGLQLGLAVDYLNEDWYYQTDLVQLRGEVSWNDGHVMTYGFQYMVGVSDDTVETLATDFSGNAVRSNEFFEATDQYRFIVRRKLGRCGYYTGFSGWTDDNDGLIGSSVDMPLTSCLLLNTNGTYLVPNEGRNRRGNEQESWNLSLGITWRIGGVSYGRQTRSLFDVADNGTFILNRR